MRNNTRNLFKLASVPNKTAMKEKICVIGLGYVGLPLAVLLSKHLEVIGFDVNKKRVEELKRNYDWTAELTKEELAAAKIKYTNSTTQIKNGTFFIITVPTPITDKKIPDLQYVKQAAELVGKNISKEAVIVLESTVYPGVTEEVVAPIIEKASRLKCGKDFTMGYSPERINPGDKEHTIDKVIKVVSGQDAKTLKRVSAVYKTVCKAGVFEAASIKTAEAEKLVENIQRDVNIALMNELSTIFHKIGIRTKDALDAAATKWNFMKFSPGLVGGHCIGKDSYYLAFKAKELGHKTEFILEARKINDSMPEFVVDMLARHLKKLDKSIAKCKVLILGLTFKENVKDCRNSRVANIIALLRSRGSEVYAFDPLLVNEPELVKHHFNIEITPFEKIKKVDAVILAVPHSAFKSLTLKKLKAIMPKKPLLFDLKNFFDRSEAGKLGFLVENL